MTICVVVLASEQSAETLKTQFEGIDQPILQCLVIPPQGDLIDSVELLNPNLTRRRRQKAMARWLMPFGFMAGLTFTKITNLTTFAGFGPLGRTGHRRTPRYGIRFDGQLCRCSERHL